MLSQGEGQLHFCGDLLTLQDYRPLGYQMYNHGRSSAEPVLVNELGEAIICFDRQSHTGNMYMTTLDPDYHFGQGFIPKVETFLDGFLAWIEEDMMKRSSETSLQLNNS